MMRQRVTIGLLVVAALWLFTGAVVAEAGVQNSNHDMIARLGLTGGSAQAGTCSFCHVPHKAASATLFPADCTVTGQWGNDPNAKLCYTCHGWDRFASTPAHNVNPFGESADGVHGRFYDNLVTWGDVASTSAFQGYSIPYDCTTNTSISCASCHNPHDNDKRPFIRDSLRSQTYTEGNLGTFCVACHVERGNNAKTGNRTNHPFNDNIADTASANIKDFAAIGPNFDTAVAALDCVMTGVAWNLGGHVYTSGSDSILHCGTCHLTHSNETSTFSSDADGSTKVATKVQNLNGSLLAYAEKPADSSTSDVICMNCHDATNSTAGPGMTGGSHPFDEVGTWSLSINATGGSGVATLYGAKFGGTIVNDGSGPTRLICQSCHDAHFARKPRNASVLPDNNYRLIRVTCDECHGTVSTASGHHPSGITVNAGKFGTVTPTSTVPLVYSTDTTKVTTNLNNKVTVGSAFTWANIDNTDFLGITDASNQQWRTQYTAQASAYYTFGGTDNNVITCGTCHGGSNSRAHNNTGGFPGLTGTMTDDLMCVDCHSTNPTRGVTNFADNTDRYATHLVGVPQEGGDISEKYKWNYGTTTAVTPKSGVDPRYATGNTDNNALICTSCHTLKFKGSVVVQHSDNDGDNESNTDNVTLLLTPSGNDADDTSGDNADYICSACHGDNPGATGGQFTHKTQPGYQTAITGSVLTEASKSNNYVTLNAVDKVNCESCHRPHVAAGTGKTYILEDAGTPTSYIEETNLCVRCHIK